MSHSSSPTITLVEWKPLARNSLRGFAAITLRNGLTIRDIAVHKAGERAWASLPSKPLVGKDGQTLKDAATGKVKYTPVLEWPDRDTADRFSDAVIGAIEAAYPGGVR